MFVCCCFYCFTELLRKTKQKKTGQQATKPENIDEYLAMQIIW